MQSSHLKYGDILTIRLSRDQFYFSSHGFVSTNIRGKKIKELQQDDISECLFELIPLQQYRAFKEAQEFDENDQIKLQKKQKTLDKLADEMQENEKIRQLNTGQEIQFYQNFLIQHLSSKKILSIKNLNQNDDQFGLQLQQIPLKEFTFSFEPYFTYRNNKETYIEYEEQIILQMNLQENRYSQYYFYQNEESLQNKQTIIENEDIYFTNNSKKTPIILQKYVDYSVRTISKNQIKSGDIIQLNHIKSSRILAYSNQRLILKNQQELKQQIVDSLWIIEKQNQEQGGTINWLENFRIKNFESCRYIESPESLNDEKESSTIIESDFIKELQTSYNLDNTTLFQLQNEKGIEETPKNSAIEFNQTFSIGLPQQNNCHTINVHFNVQTTFFEPIIQKRKIYKESFKAIKLTDLQIWEIMFSKDCNMFFQKKLLLMNKIINNNQWDFTFGDQFELNKLLDSLFTIQEFLFHEVYYMGPIFRNKTQNLIRSKIFIEQNIHVYLREIIMVLLNDKYSLDKIQEYVRNYFLQEQRQINIGEQKLNKYEKEKQKQQNAKNIKLQGKYLNSKGLIKRLNLSETADKNLLTKKKANFFCQLIINTCQVMAYLCNDPNFPQDKIIQFINFTSKTIRQGLNGWQCLTNLLRSTPLLSQLNEQEYYKVVFHNQEISLFHDAILSGFDYKKMLSLIEIDNNIITLSAQICINNNKINRGHQIWLGSVILNDELLEFRNSSQLFMQYTTFYDSATNEKQLYVKFQDNYIPLEEFDIATQQTQQQNIMDIFISQIRLYCLLCENRCYPNIQMIRQKFPYYMILKYINNYKLNFSLRSVFLDLYLFLYIDVSPLSSTHSWQTKLSGKNDQGTQIAEESQTFLLSDNHSQVKWMQEIKNLEHTNKLYEQEQYQYELYHDYEKYFQYSRNTKLQKIDEQKYQNLTKLEFAQSQWVEQMRETILNLFTTTFEGGKYQTYLSSPGFSCFLLSLVRMMRAFIILKEFDISDPESDVDDKILSWSFTILKSFSTQNDHPYNIRSKAAKVNLGQNQDSPYIKNVQMDFNSYKADNDLINNLKGLIIEVFELKLKYLQDDMIIDFMDDIQTKFNNIQADKIQISVTKYIEDVFCMFVENEMRVFDHLEENEEFCICSKEFVSIIIQQFQKSTDFEYHMKLLRLLFLISNRKSTFVKKIRDIQFIFDSERKKLFKINQMLIDQLRYFQQRAVTWIQCDNDKSINLSVKFLQQLKRMQELLRKAKTLLSPQEDTLYSMQKQLQSLNFHIILLDFLFENVNVAKLDHLTQIQQDIFTSAFSILKLLIRNNLTMKQILITNNFENLIESYLILKEYGQTKLLISIYQNDYNIQTKISKQMLGNFVTSLRQKIAIQQINPNYLKFLEQIIVFQNELIDLNVQKLIDEIFFTSKIYDLLGMGVQKQNKKGEQSQDGSTIIYELNESKLPQKKNDNQFFYIFELNFINQNNLPYVYQSYALKIIRNILSKIKQKDALRDILTYYLNLNYICVILSKHDFYSSNQYVYDELFFMTVLKNELIQLTYEIFFEEDKPINNLEYNGFLIDFVKTQIKVLKGMTRKEKERIRSQINQIRMGEGLNSLQGNSNYTYLIQFINEYYPVKQTNSIILNEPFEYTVYLHKILLPFLSDINKCLQIRVKQMGGPQFLELNQIGWDILQEISPAYLNFFNNILNDQEKYECYEKFKSQIEQLKITFNLQLDTEQYQKIKIQPYPTTTPVQQVIVKTKKDTNTLYQRMPQFRNILAIKRGESDREAYILLFQQILTNSYVKIKLVQNESEFLINLLRENMSLDQQSSDQDDKRSFPTNQILDLIVLHIIKALKYMQNDADFKEIIYNTFNLLGQFISSYTGQPELFDIQEFIYNSSLPRVVIENLCLPTSYESEEIVCEQISFLTSLLIGNNTIMQQKFYQQFIQNTKIENLVFFIYKFLEKENKKLLNIQNAQEKSAMLLQEIIYNYEKNDRQLIFKCLKFIKITANDHFLDFQTFWKYQKNFNNSYDILEQIVKLIDGIIRSYFLVKQDEIIINDHHYFMLIQCLKTVLSLIQGKCYENRQNLIAYSFLENISVIIKVNELLIDQEYENKYENQEFKSLGLSIKIEGKITRIQINALKNMCLKIIECLIENDKQNLMRKLIVRTLDFNILAENMSRIYQNFITQNKGNYSLASVKNLKDGFLIYLLLRDLDETNIKDRIGKKKSQAKINDMDSSFYQANQFFGEKCSSIEILNEKEELQEIFFWYLPHLKALNEDIMYEIQEKIDRSNIQIKLQNFMSLAEGFNKQLYYEQSFIENASISKLFFFIVILGKNMRNQRRFNFIFSIVMNIQLIINYIQMDVYAPPEGTSLNPILINNSLFSTCLWIQNINCAIILILFVVQNRNYINWQIDKQKSLMRLQSSDDDDNQIQSIASHIKKVAKQISIWNHITIFLSNWLNNSAVPHMLAYILILLLAQYFHELFVTLLLLDMLYIFPESQNVFKAFLVTRYKLISALFLWIIFVYLFSIIAYLTLQSLYTPICYNLLTCFSVLFREIFRIGRIGGLYKKLENYLNEESQINSGPNGEYFITWGGVFDYLQIFFLVGCLFSWTFTSLIVESYGYLRAISNYKMNDIENICLPCNFSREEITKKCDHGFDQHVENEHNQWNYLIYMATLYAKNEYYMNGDENEQFSGTEKYVFEKIKSKKIHWFPLNKSLHFH